MEATPFDLEEKLLGEEIRKRGAKRVLIQLPEGLKREGPRLAAIAEKSGALAIVSTDPCYGACDLAIFDAKNLDADLIIHYGHSKMTEQEQMPTIYVEAKAKVDVEEAVRKAISLLKRWHKIGLITTVQHVHVLNVARDLLLEAGKTVIVGDAGHLKHPGQVTGCDYSNAKFVAKEIEAFLFLGGGRFHALGATLATAKPTVIADPFEKRAYSTEKGAQKILRQRWASIFEAEKAKNFGVLVGLKTGQKNLHEALQIKKKLEKSGKNATLLSAKEITPDALMQFSSLDAFVNTACPRVSLDETSKFLKPVLTSNEALVLVGEIKWEELCREGLFGS